MIIPSIIAKNFEAVKAKLVQLEGIAAWAQLDVMDGRFVLPTTWDVAEDLVMVDGRIRLEAHLMINGPEERVSDWAQYVDRVLVHYEATTHCPEIAASFTNSHCQFGVVLNFDTPIDVLTEFESTLSLVQLMSIKELGHYGAPLDEGIYDRIRQVKNDFPHLKISVDGGVKMANAAKLLAAGADNLVIGSALWDAADLLGTFKQFEDLA